jgi:hypothetical protein
LKNKKYKIILIDVFYKLKTLILILKFLESEINKTFQTILKQKLSLENENKTLLLKLSQYEEVIKEFKNNEGYLQVIGYFKLI